MIVKSVAYENYRNIENSEFYPSDEVNVIYGENAQGKTNILEGIWIFTGGRSFRGSRDREVVMKGKNFSKVDMSFESEGRLQEAVLRLSDKKRDLDINLIKQAQASNIVGKFCSVVFSPIHLSLIKDGPAMRRHFLDAAICQMRPKYAAVISEYKHILAQRNTLLKNIQNSSSLFNTLDVWDRELAIYGAVLTKTRINYAKILKEKTKEMYYGISSGKERIDVNYTTFFDYGDEDEKAIIDILLDEYKKKRNIDLSTGFTSVGPHRDDINININGLSARIYASQGQQRSAVLAMKLSEAIILEKKIGEKPVILLDDVMSELDTTRQNYLLNNIKGWQVFITCCDPANVMRYSGTGLFKMNNGQIEHCKN